MVRSTWLPKTDLIGVSNRKGATVEDEDKTVKEETAPKQEEEEGDTVLSCKAFKCFRNINGTCLLADLLRGEGKITLSKEAICEDYCPI
jgi:hypothetical protein